MEQSTVTTQMNHRTCPSPRTIYLCEPKNSSFNTANRIIALTFSYNENGDIYYGASIFHRSDKKELFLKHAIRETSVARYKNAPVHINMRSFNVTKFNVYYPKSIPEVDYMTKSGKPKMNNSDNVQRVRKNENLPCFEDVVKTARKAMYTFGVCQRRQLSVK
jgi:hypothetical protein